MVWVKSAGFKTMTTDNKDRLSCAAELPKVDAMTTIMLVSYNFRCGFKITLVDHFVQSWSFGSTLISVCCLDFIGVPFSEV